MKRTNTSGNTRVSCEYTHANTSFKQRENFASYLLWAGHNESPSKSRLLLFLIIIIILFFMLIIRGILLVYSRLIHCHGIIKDKQQATHLSFFVLSCAELFPSLHHGLIGGYDWTRNWTIAETQFNWNIEWFWTIKIWLRFACMQRSKLMVALRNFISGYQTFVSLL